MDTHEDLVHTRVVPEREAPVSHPNQGERSPWSPGPSGKRWDVCPSNPSAFFPGVVAGGPALHLNVKEGARDTPGWHRAPVVGRANMYTWHLSLQISAGQPV